MKTITEFLVNTQIKKPSKTTYKDYITQNRLGDAYKYVKDVKDGVYIQSDTLYGIVSDIPFFENSEVVIPLYFKIDNDNEKIYANSSIHLAFEDLSSVRILNPTSGLDEVYMIHKTEEEIIKHKKLQYLLDCKENTEIGNNSMWDEYGMITIDKFIH